MSNTKTYEVVVKDEIIDRIMAQVEGCDLEPGFVLSVVLQTTYEYFADWAPGLRRFASLWREFHSGSSDAEGSSS